MLNKTAFSKHELLLHLQVNRCITLLEFIFIHLLIWLNKSLTSPLPQGVSRLLLQGNEEAAQNLHQVNLSLIQQLSSDLHSRGEQFLHTLFLHRKLESSQMVTIWSKWIILIPRRWIRPWRKKWTENLK